MKSMTGFGFAEQQDQSIHLTADLKSYNNRYLDLIINLPPPLGPLEPAIREKLGSRLKRGRVELYLRLRELEEDLNIIIDRDAAHTYADSLRELGRELGIGEELKLSHILEREGVLKVDKKRDLDALGARVDSLLDEVLDQLVESRIREGKATAENIMAQLDQVAASLEQIRALAPGVEARVRETLQGKFTEFAGDLAEESRILQEIASYLVRYDINEEISRLGIHIDSFRSTAAGEGSVGKKLDFLCQEMNREINTIGSKTPQVEVSRLVVEMKDAMEKVREQLRNVE